MNEAKTIEKLNSFGLKLRPHKDKYATYDAYDSNYIVEIKNVRKDYGKDLMLADKLYKNYQKSQIFKKDFLYAVTVESSLYLYNISKLITSIVKTPPAPLKIPVTTDFENNEKIIKYSYFLDRNLAKKIDLTLDTD
jgi:hypothetical protein